MLRGEFQPLYALLDAACDERIVHLLRTSGEEHQSLYEGSQAEEMAHFAPYLVRLPADSALLKTLEKTDTAKSWGVYLSCEKPFQELRKHLRRFLMVELPNGKKVLFRYYDPRVLRAFLPTCNAAEAAEFFGPVKRYAMADENPEVFLEFTLNAGQVHKVKLPLAEETHV